jgi:hypothetical protein
MPKPLFATFPLSDTFSQHFYGEVAAKFLAALETVSDCLRYAVNTNRHAINSHIDDSLCECLAGEAGEAQPQVSLNTLPQQDSAATPQIDPMTRDIRYGQQSGR